MPKLLNRPTTATPPYPWKGYIESLESKIDRLQAELQNLRAEAQVEGLSLFDAAPPEEPPTPAELSRVEEDYEQDALGGFTADSETSRNAALANYPRSGRQRHQILMAVFRAGAYGKTFDEIRDDLSIYSADRRMSELAEGGWLEVTERTRKTNRGSDARVMVCTPKAVDAIKWREPQLFAQVNG